MQHHFMHRRHFALGAAATALTLPLAARAQKSAPVEGKQYLRLKTPAPVQAGEGKVEVIEFFWYSCGHCNAFEPRFAAWKNQAPAHVEVRRLPVAFNASFVPQQKLFFALQAMPEFEAMHLKVFDAIHNRRLKLNTDEAIFAWIAQQGVDVQAFKTQYSSFTVANQVRHATQMQQAYHVDGVPSIGVAGLYYTDGTLAGSEVLRVTDYLVAQARKG